MSARTVAFVGALCHYHLQLLPILAEHLEEQRGEILPHLLMADVERWSEVSLHSNRAAVEKVLKWIEAQFCAGDPEIQELIFVSFLENLPQVGQKNDSLRDLLGPSMFVEAEQLRHDS